MLRLIRSYIDLLAGVITANVLVWYILYLSATVWGIKGLIFFMQKQNTGFYWKSEGQQSSPSSVVTLFKRLHLPQRRKGQQKQYSIMDGKKAS
jgi:hypothetical protein